MQDISDKISAFLQENGIDFQDSSRSYITTCPKCRKKKLYISKNEGFFTCFVCSEEGMKGPTPFYALALLSGISKEEIKHKFENDYFEDKPQIKQIVKPTREVYIPNRFLSIADEQAQEGAQYVLRRGVPVSISEAYNVKYDPDKKQVVFLIKENDIPVGFQGRSILKDCPKELSKYTSPGFEKSKHFIFQEYIKGDSVIIAEGPFSAIKFAKTGITFLASMGKAISSSQMEKLVGLGIRKVYLALDTDAFKEINRFIVKYRNIFDIYYVSVPNHREDFGTCTFEECIKAISQSRKVFMPLEVDPESIKWMF